MSCFTRQVVYIDANTSYCRVCEKDIPNAHATSHMSNFEVIVEDFR